MSRGSAGCYASWFNSPTPPLHLYCVQEAPKGYLLSLQLLIITVHWRHHQLNIQHPCMHYYGVSRSDFCTQKLKSIFCIFASPHIAFGISGIHSNTSIVCLCKLAKECNIRKTFRNSFQGGGSAIFVENKSAGSKFHQNSLKKIWVRDNTQVVVSHY